MNKVVLMGRLTRDPEVRYSQGENALAIARYTLAVDRRFKRDGEQTADFINCVVFGIYRTLFPSGNARSGLRKNPDRKLYQQGWCKGLYNRSCC